MSLIAGDFGNKLLRGPGSGLAGIRVSLPIAAEPGPTEGAHLLMGTDILALSGDQSDFDLGLSGTTDRQLEELPLIVGPSGSSYVVIATATGTRRVTIDTLKELLEI
jgi:hypothetical protein